MRCPGDMFAPHKTAKWKEIRNYLFFPLVPRASQAAVLPLWLRKWMQDSDFSLRQAEWTSSFSGVPSGCRSQADTPELCEAILSVLCGLAWQRTAMRCKVFQLLDKKAQRKKWKIPSWTFIFSRCCEIIVLCIQEPQKEDGFKFKFKCFLNRLTEIASEIACPSIQKQTNLFAQGC